MKMLHMDSKVQCTVIVINPSSAFEYDSQNFCSQAGTPCLFSSRARDCGCNAALSASGTFNMMHGRKAPALLGSALVNSDCMRRADEEEIEEEGAKAQRERGCDGRQDAVHPAGAAAAAGGDGVLRVGKAREELGPMGPLVLSCPS